MKRFKYSYGEVKLFFIFIFALFLRIYLLGKFPIGITHDELNYVFSAKSLFLTGRFLPGVAPAIFPTAMNNPSVVIAEIPAVLLAPFIGFTEFSMFNSRIIGSILSAFLVIIIYFLVLTLFKNRFYAVISAILMAINPWSFLMGRTIFETNFYIFFSLLGLLILFNKRNWKILYSLPFYIVGFFSYTGGQIVFYMFSIITLVFHYFVVSKRYVKPHLIFGIIMTIIFFGYIFTTSNNQTLKVRQSELYLPTSLEVTEEVNRERLVSTPSFLNRLFVNKLTIYSHGFLDKYLGAFSPSLLFNKGELRAAYSYQKHGMFYLVDFILIILGIAVIFLKNKKIWLFFISMIMVAPITSGLSTVEYSYGQRASLMFPFLVILSGVGLSYLITLISKYRFRNLLKFIILSTFILSLLNLLYIYFFRFPVYASDGWFYQDRILARYIQLANKNPDQNIYVYSSEPRFIFEEYLFFTNLYNKVTAKSINKILEGNKYYFGNVYFDNSCPEGESLDNGSVRIYDVLLNCLSEKKNTLRITRFQDVAEKYLIKNDTICTGSSLGTYVTGEAYKNFDLNSLSVGEFCSNWITRLQ